MDQPEIFNEVTLTECRKHINDYIILGGKGLLGGKPTCTNKRDANKIISVEDDRIYAKFFGCKRLSYLPSYEFNQSCMFITEKEYKKLQSGRIYD